MKTGILRFFIPVAASLLSGFALVLSFPKYDLWWLAWTALVLLLLAIHGQRPLHGFLLSFAFGIVFIAGVFNWVLTVSAYTLYHHAILVFYLALYSAIFGLIVTIIARRRRFSTGLLAAPFVWVSLEYIRSNLSFLALPWALLAHSQHQVLPIVQISSITGAWGVGFLIVLVNSALTITLIAVFSKRMKTSGSTPGHRQLSPVKFYIPLTVAVLLALVLVYGQTVLSRPANGKQIKVSVLQGNIAQSRKWDPDFADYIMKTYSDLSRLAAGEKPQLIVWPEAATPGFILKNVSVYKQIAALIRETDTYYLMGSSEYPKFQKTPLKLEEVGNSAVFFAPQGKVLGQYLKIHGVPFMEYIPYAGVITWPEFIVPEGETSGEIQGTEFTVFKGPDFRFSVTICWETIFPDLVRQFVKHGAQFMVNIGNEAWFGKSASPYQFLSFNVFRAVENRVFIVKCANTGISSFIDPYGRINGRLQDSKGEELFIRGVLTDSVIPMDSNTIYTRYGDWFCWLSAGISIVFLAMAFSKKIRNR